jgi:uncharacterized membrane protein
MSPFKDPIHFFLCFSFLFGMIFTFLIPPFQSPDEYNHFYKSWQVSDGYLLPQKLGENRLGGYLPKSLTSLKNQFHYLKDDHQAKTSFHALQKASSIKLDLQDTVFTDFANTAIYAPTSYLPHILAIQAAKGFDIGPLVSLYLVRLINLFAWMLLVTLALKRLNFQQWSIVYITCLPSFIVMSASANADNVTNGIGILLLAIFCTTKQFSYLIKIILLIVVCINKIIFLPLVLLDLIHKKSDYSFVLLSVIAMSATLIWASYAQDKFIAFEDYHKAYRLSQTMNEGVNPKLQLQYISDHPITFVKTVVFSFTESMPATTVHLFGKFGWEKNYLPYWMIGLLILGLIMMMSTQSNPLSNKVRVLIAVSLFLGLTLFSIIMYMIWCPVGSPVLDNIGGRYFFVFLAMIPMIVGGNYLKLDVTKLHFAAKVILILGNLAMVYCIFERYY